MVAQFEIYEQIRALSGRMVDAARAGDWDTLIELEAAAARLRVILATEEEASASLTPEESTRKTALIQGILDDDAEVRRHTEPWMERLRIYLGGPLSAVPGAAAGGRPATS